MRRIISGIAALSIASFMLVTGCDTDSKVKSRAELQMTVNRVSCGFCEVHFMTSHNAYFLIGIDSVRHEINPYKVEEQFKSLALDKAYMDYIIWRHSLLYEGVPHIAEFSSHSLQYCDATYVFNELEPDTDYWVYGFIVDPDSNRPDGELILQQIHTKSSSEEKISFKYRINGYWDYVYPLDENNEVNSYLPWVAETVDSLALRQNNIEFPAMYFIDRFMEISKDPDARILYGMYGYKNDGYGDGFTNTLFEEGHTYYTGIASFDGPLIYSGEYRNVCIYKFTWSENLKQILTKEDDIYSNW